jgi:hypothetical protein
MGMVSSTDGEKRNAYVFLLGKPGGKISLGGPRRRRMNNTNKDLEEKELGGMD